jgi:sec1 family domain-containing protein 1
MKPISP